MPWIERVKTKLDELRARDPECRVFGADHHHYRLGPTLEPAVLEEIESRYRVRFPAEFRRFVLEVGNGGATYFDTAVSQAADSFPLRQPFALSRSLLPMSLFEGVEDAVPDDEVDAEYAAADAGTYALSDYGCAIAALLVVTGPRAGEVWVDEGSIGYVVNYSCWAEHSEGAAIPVRSDFASWYERWLDVSLEECTPETSNRRTVAELPTRLLSHPSDELVRARARRVAREAEARAAQQRKTEKERRRT